MLWCARICRARCEVCSEQCVVCNVRSARSVKWKQRVVRSVRARSVQCAVGVVRLVCVVRAVSWSALSAVCSVVRRQKRATCVVRAM